jgi:hypothetical protein
MEPLFFATKILQTNGECIIWAFFLFHNIFFRQKLQTKQPRQKKLIRFSVN